VNVPMVIAVSDRGGNLLGLYKKANAPVKGLANFSQMAIEFADRGISEGGLQFGFK
jgi:hypothetical protein